MDDRFWKRPLLNDKLASWILAVCAIVLIVSLGAVVIISRCKRVEPHRVEIAFVPMDSIPAWQVSDSAEQATSAFTKTATPSGVDMVMFPRAELDSLIKEMAAAKALVCPLIKENLNYCVGLSTIADAEGLNKPLIITENAYHGNRPQEDNFYSVKSVKQWVEAINAIQSSNHKANQSSYSMQKTYQNMARIMKL